MNLKLALNLYGLDNRAKLAKLQTAVTKCTGNADIGTPTNPPLADCQASHDDAEAKLDLIDTQEEELKQLRLQRDQLLDAAMSNYGTLGAFALSNSP